jgi:hypothetical protein
MVVNTRIIILSCAAIGICWGLILSSPCHSPYAGLIFPLLGTRGITFAKMLNKHCLCFGSCHSLKVLGLFSSCWCGDDGYRGYSILSWVWYPGNG